MNFNFHKITSLVWNLQRFTRVFTMFGKFDFHFSDSQEKFSLVSLQMTDYIFRPLKNVKKNAIFFKLFWYKVFVHWELKLLNFLVDCVLIFIVFTSFKRLLCQDVPIDQYTFDGVYQWSLTPFLLAPEEVETSFNPSIWIFQFLIFLIFFMC